MSANSPDLGEIVGVLSIRRDALGALSTESRDVRDLRDDLGCSRSTAYKALRELQSHELVEEVGGEYRLTLLGRLLFERYERFLSEADALIDHRDALTALPPDLPVDSSVFADATIVAPDPISPDLAVDALESFIADAARFRSFTPVTRDRYRSFGLSLLERGDVSIEMIHNSEVLEYVLSDRSDQMRRFLESDRTTYYRTDATFPFGLVIADEPERRVGLTLYDEDARLQAFVAAEGREAYEWADELYESYRRDAEPLTADAIGESESRG